MLKRCITALILASIAIPCLALQGPFFMALIAFFILFAIVETVGLIYNKWSKISSIIIFIAMVLINWGMGYMLGNDGYFYATSLGIPILIFIIVLAIIFDCHSDIYDGAIIVLFSLIFLMALKMIVFVGDGKAFNINGFTYFYVFIASLLCDTGAYLVGRKWGKHKLIERLSPKKTIEGAIGGWIFGFVFSFGFVYICSLISHTSFNVGFYIINSALLPIFSELGDLFFSAVKRNYGIKDYGNIFPGHGGVLDRIDGLLFCLCAYLLIPSIINFIYQLFVIGI